MLAILRLFGEHSVTGNFADKKQRNSRIGFCPAWQNQKLFKNAETIKRNVAMVSDCQNYAKNPSRYFKELYHFIKYFLCRSYHSFEMSTFTSPYVYGSALNRIYPFSSLALVTPETNRFMNGFVV